MASLLDWLPMILSVVGVIGVGGLLLLLGMWPVVSSFLIGTKLGRVIVMMGAFMLVVLYAYIAGKSTGAKRERAKQKAATMATIRKRIKIDEDVRKMPPSDRRRELDKWVRG